jgi:transposase InsO family protein
MRALGLAGATRSRRVRTTTPAPVAERPADLALDALEMAVWARGGDPAGLVHHSDRGVEYLSIRYSERLADAGIAASVGSRGDSDDNALAETVNGLYKAELIHRRARWRSVAEVELATADWVAFWNHRRLPLGDRIPAARRVPAGILRAPGRAHRGRLNPTLSATNRTAA